MSHSILESRDFDQYLSLSEKAEREQALASNDAFVLAMARAVRRGREKATPGTYVDTSPAINARRIRGEARVSSCGSPAAMCLESGARAGGAVTLK